MRFDNSTIDPKSCLLGILGALALVVCMGADDDVGAGNNGKGILARLGNLEELTSYLQLEKGDNGQVTALVLKAPRVKTEHFYADSAIVTRDLRVQNPAQANNATVVQPGFLLSQHGDVYVQVGDELLIWHAPVNLHTGVLTITHDNRNEHIVIGPADLKLRQGARFDNNTEQPQPLPNRPNKPKLP